MGEDGCGGLRKSEQSTPVGWGVNLYESVNHVLYQGLYKMGNETLEAENNFCADKPWVHVP